MAAPVNYRAHQAEALADALKRVGYASIYRGRRGHIKGQRQRLAAQRANLVRDHCGSAAIQIGHDDLSC
jgi:ABC-type thiamine transport system ATPase subunit